MSEGTYLVEGSSPKTYLLMSWVFTLPRWLPSPWCCHGNMLLARPLSIYIMHPELCSVLLYSTSRPSSCHTGKVWMSALLLCYSLFIHLRPWIAAATSQLLLTFKQFYQSILSCMSHMQSMGYAMYTASVYCAKLQWMWIDLEHCMETSDQWLLSTHVCIWGWHWRWLSDHSVFFWLCFHGEGRLSDHSAFKKKAFWSQ